jgi:hypothetical protein
MSDVKSELAEAKQELKDALLKVSEIAKRNLGSTTELVSAGKVLWDIVDESNSILETIKPILREEAMGMAQGDYGTIKIPGLAEGEAAEVRIVEPSPKLRKDADMLKAKEILGDTFDNYFQTVYKPKKAIQNQIVKTASVEHRDLVANMIDLKSSKPAVFLGK